MERRTSHHWTAHRLGRRPVLAALALAPWLARASGVQAQEAQESQETPDFSASLESAVFGARSPWGVAVDRQGRVHITDSQQHQVVRRAPDSVWFQIISSEGTAAGHLRRPQGIALDPSGEIYVVDGGNQRIQVFSAEGVFLRGWGGRGGDPGEFRAPRGIDIGPDGHVYVADGFNDRIQKFTPEGEFVASWGSRGREEGQFSSPTGIAVSPSGTVFVADRFRDRVQAFTPDGVFVRFAAAAPDIRSPVGVAVDAAERLYVSEDVDHRVAVFDPDGTLIGRFGVEGRSLGQFHFPRDVALDEAGKVYVADSFNLRVQVFATSLPALTPPPGSADLSIGIALTSPHASPLPHNIVDLQVRLDDELWTIGFRSYFRATGGLRRWGWAISEPLREHAGTVTQYFQRGVMDWASDGRGGYAVFPRPVWDYIGGGRGGAPDMGVETAVLSDQPGEVVGDWGHRVSNFAIDGTEVGFADFFDEFGGREMFGAPRTEARVDTGAAGTVFDWQSTRGVIRQYFQNAVFEHAPSLQPPVQLKLLGVRLRDRSYPNESWQTVGPFADAAPVAVGEQIPIELVTA